MSNHLLTYVDSLQIWLWDIFYYKALMHNNKKERGYKNQAINPLVQHYRISVEMYFIVFILFILIHYWKGIELLIGPHATLETNTFIVNQ